MKTTNGRVSKMEIARRLGISRTTVTEVLGRSDAPAADRSGRYAFRVAADFIRQAAPRAWDRSTGKDRLLNEETEKFFEMVDHRLRTALCDVGFVELLSAGATPEEISVMIADLLDRVGFRLYADVEEGIFWGRLGLTASEASVAENYSREWRDPEDCRDAIKLARIIGRLRKRLREAKKSADSVKTTAGD
jgi:hypothetical protein